jgi:hypothetical protein
VHTSRSRRFALRLGIALAFVAVVIGFGSVSPTVAGDDPATDEPAPALTSDQPSADTGSTTPPPAQTTESATDSGPYGAGYPVTVEPNFSRPNGGYMRGKDFTLLNDLERLIRGSYKKPDGTKQPKSVIDANYVYISISRMENAHRVSRELIAAAKAGVDVYVIHGKASQSKESRYLQSQMDKLAHGHFHICVKGKSLACLSSLNGAIMHSKVLIIRNTFTRDNKPALGAVWSGSANLGGPSGEYTFNNGWTVYNDKKLFLQFRQFFNDMLNERSVGNNYPAYVADHNTNYGYSTAQDDGYVYRYASYGMFYSNLANVTYYMTPIRATPSNGRDPVINMLNRIVPDKTCHIRLQENRFKYRRIAVAQKLVRLSAAGCTVEAVAFKDELSVNRKAHCQQWIRICRPILDVFRTSVTRIPAAYAKPHDKTILVEAKMRQGRWNIEERLPNGQTFGSQPGGVAFVRLVQAGSAALTGSNQIVSDEITTETTDPSVYKEYLEHWFAIQKSTEHRVWAY